MDDAVVFLHGRSFDLTLWWKASEISADLQGVREVASIPLIEGSSTRTSTRFRHSTYSRIRSVYWFPFLLSLDRSVWPERRWKINTVSVCHIRCCRITVHEMSVGAHLWKRIRHGILWRISRNWGNSSRLINGTFLEAHGYVIITVKYKQWLNE